MTFVKKSYSNNQINRAGEILVKQESFGWTEQIWASEVLANWRGCHAYAINTFQATLREKLKAIDNDAIVAQRLKRAPSIISKLQRFAGMKLARMQDIGGLRAVVGSIAQLRDLEAAYANARFNHRLSSHKDYLEEPKEDGYRSIHLIYRYANHRAPEYNDLSIELQLRTRLQHAWATAVETMGTFLGQALKSGQGEAEWRHFFAQAGAALAVIENTTPVPGFEGKSSDQVFSELAASEASLRVLKTQRFCDCCRSDYYSPWLWYLSSYHSELCE